MTYRLRTHPRDTTVDFTSRTLRGMTLFALTGYPVGVVLDLNLGDANAAAGLAGGLLKIAALVTMVAVASSTLAKIVLGENETKLDEFQLGLRLAAMSKAYAALSALLGTSGTYAYFAVDFGWPVPTSAEAWQQICGGLVLAILMLPAAFLVWSPDAALAEPDAVDE